MTSSLFIFISFPQWVKPEGRSFFESRSPARDEFLAKTVQGTKEDVDLAVSGLVDFVHAHYHRPPT